MKVFCKSCGCHFPEDFEETLLTECTYWSRKGFPSDFPKKYLRLIWDAMISIPYDEIADKTGVIVTMPEPNVSIKTYIGNEFEEHIPGYKEWDDDKRRRFQKGWFKHYYTLDRDHIMTPLMIKYAIDQGWTTEEYIKEHLKTDESKT